MRASVCVCPFRGREEGLALLGEFLRGVIARCLVEDGAELGRSVLYVYARHDEDEEVIWRDALSCYRSRSGGWKRELGSGQGRK